MIELHLPGESIELDQESGESWASLATVASALSIGLKALDDDRFGLCPDPDSCVQVPPSSIRGGSDGPEIRVGWLADALGLPVAADDRNIVLLEEASLEQGGGPLHERVDLALPDWADGQLRELAVAGQPNMIFVWASWCPCRQQLPSWQSFYSEILPPGFRFLTVAVDAQGAEVLRPWLEEAGATFTTLVDSRGQLLSGLGVNITPTLLLTDAEVRLCSRPRVFDIRRTGDAEALRDWLRHPEAALRGAAAGAQEVDRASMARAQAWAELASLSLADGRREAAIAQLEVAVRLCPASHVNRSQLWALKHPERFYEGPVDEEWWEAETARVLDRQSTGAPRGS